MKQVQKNFFNRYILSDQVSWCNLKLLLSYPKNYICKFMQVILWHHELFHFHLPTWIWKVWKGREKITNVWISRERKELFRWNKKHFFIVFKGLSFGEKNENLIKKKRTQALIFIIPEIISLNSLNINRLSANPTKWSNSSPKADRLFESVWPFCGIRT